MIRERTKAYVVRQSPLHGRGLFAGRAIKKGTRIVPYLGYWVESREYTRRVYAEQARNPRVCVYAFGIDGKFLEGDLGVGVDNEVRGRRGGNPASWMNHSCEPNCEAVDFGEGDVFLVATRRIRRGEELTFDYGFTPDVMIHHPCECGARSCLGFIVGAEYRDGLRARLRAMAAKAKAKR